MNIANLDIFGDEGVGTWNFVRGGKEGCKLVYVEAFP